MKICLDNIIFSLQRAGGISVYWAELLKYLSAGAADFYVIERPEAARNIQRSQLGISPSRIVADSPIPLNLGRYLGVDPCSDTDLFHSSYYRVPRRAGDARQVVTVYDFTYELYRSGLRRAVHRHQKHRAIRSADGIICISESTKRDLLRLYPDSAGKSVTVIPLGVSGGFCPLGDDLLWPDVLSTLAGKRYVLFVGDRSEYKNFDLAVQAVGRMSGLQLAIVGGGVLTPSESCLLERCLPGRYQHLSGLDEKMLNVLYNRACCLLYPSSYEGFGLPTLEAMSAGCPVISVNCSSMPEVCGDAALLADRPAVDQFCEYMEMLQDPAARQMLIAKGFQQSKKFTWERTWEDTMAFYRTITDGLAKSVAS